MTIVNAESPPSDPCSRFSYSVKKPREQCAICGEPIAQKPGRGRPRLYCGTTCRKQAEYRVAEAKKQAANDALRRRLEIARYRDERELTEFIQSISTTTTREQP